MSQCRALFEESKDEITTVSKRQKTNHIATNPLKKEEISKPTPMWWALQTKG